MTFLLYNYVEFYIIIKKISKLLNLSHLSFGNVEEILNIKKGSVSPLNIINDKDGRVLLIIDKDLKDKKILMHPNVNTKTLSINYNDLIKFITYLNHKYVEINL